MDLYKDGILLDPESGEARAELKRLTDNGEQVGFATCWTYQGDMERLENSYAAGYFTEEQLRNFSVDGAYGYTLRLL